MKVRFIKKEDVEQATKLYCKIWPEDKAYRVKKYFKEKANKKEGFVAVDANKIIGILGFTKRYFKNSDYLDEVVVDKLHRGKGVAAALIKRFEEDAKKRKSRRVFSSTEPCNKASLLMHKKLGYKKAGYIDHMWAENKREIIFSKKVK